MKHATEFENMLADYNRRQQRQRRYTFTDDAIAKIARDAGLGYMQLDDGTVCHQQDYIRRLAHSKTKKYDVDWFMLIYCASAIVTIVTLLALWIDVYF